MNGLNCSITDTWRANMGIRLEKIRFKPAGFRTGKSSRL
jgi:hypothetical protein